MKKVLVGMFIALMGVFMVSCSNTGGIEKAKEILSELKASGANLDAEGLKAKMMEFAAAIKPEMTKMFDLMKEVEKDPSKAAKLTKELEDLEEVEKLIGELEKSVEPIPAWKDVEADEEFQKKLLETLGMPDEKQNIIQDIDWERDIDWESLERRLKNTKSLKHYNFSGVIPF